MECVAPVRRHQILRYWQDTAETTCGYRQILRIPRVFPVTQDHPPVRIANEDEGFDGRQDMTRST